MAGQLIGHPAHLAPAHGVRLSGDGERPHARFADTSRQQVTVDDGVNFVGSIRRLVDALRIHRHRSAGGVKPAEKIGQVGNGELGLACNPLYVEHCRGAQQGLYTMGVRIDEGRVASAAFLKRV
jgi:hypothetical protein